MNREKTLDSVLVFYRSNSEVNSRSIDFQIVYILKQQFKEPVCKSPKCNFKIGHNLLRNDGHFAQGQKLITFTTKIKAGD